MTHTIDKILSASNWNTVFIPGTELAVAQKLFMKLLRQVHPDLNPDRSVDAQVAFTKLNTLFNEFKLSLNDAGGVIFTSKHEFRLLEKRYQSDGYVYHNVSVDKTFEGFTVSQVNIQNTKPFLDSMRALLTVRKNVTDESTKDMLPQFLDTFNVNEGNGVKPFVAFSSTIPLRDMKTLRDLGFVADFKVNSEQVANLLSRIMVALEAIHKTGFSYGGGYIDGLMVSNDLTHILFKDWCYVSPLGGFSQNYPRAASEFIHSEVRLLRPLSSRSDISLICKAFMVTFAPFISTGLRNVLMSEHQYPSRSPSKVVEKLVPYF